MLGALAAECGMVQTSIDVAHCRRMTLPHILLPRKALVADPLTPDALQKMHAYWRAANYLSVGQIYLQDNALLDAPLTLAHIKPRLLGHWGTSPGLSFIYVHLNRLIKAHDANIIYVAGPGHGGPALNAQAYLEGLTSPIGA